MIFKYIISALQGQYHQHRATPCDLRTEPLQALKGRHKAMFRMTPFQGYKRLGHPITGCCPVLMILPFQGFDYIQGDANTITCCLFRKPK